METIKIDQYNIYEAFSNFTDRFPGLLALVITLAVVTGLIR